MAELIDWREGSSGNLLKLFDKATATGVSDKIIHLGRFEKRFQIIKHTLLGGLIGSSHLIIEVSDDPEILLNQSLASWIPQADLVIDSTDQTVSLGPGGPITLLGELTKGFTIQAGWKFVTARIIDHDGAPVSLILGV